MQFIQVSKVQKYLRGNKFQIKAEVFDAVDEFVGRSLERLIEGALSENIKSIGTDDVARFLGRPKKETNSNENVDSLAQEKEKRVIG